MSTEIFYDLDDMMHRAYTYFGRLGAFTPDAIEFVRECYAFQMDILRPWDRTD